MNTSKSIFSERLKEILKEKDISIRKLALAIGRDPSVIFRYTTGERQPSADILLEIANFFNVSTDYLLGNSDVPMPTQGKYDPLQYIPKELKDKLSILEKTPEPESLESVGHFLIELSKSLKGNKN
jgi:transcriptional regulator with XRE-family HTH domain